MPNDRKFFIAPAAFLLLFTLAFVYEIYIPHSKQKGKIEVEVEQGLGSRKIGELLLRGGVIRSKWAFVIYVSLRGEAPKLKAGTYTFFNSSVPEITRDLVLGETREISITIPEGWSNKDITLYLEKQNILPSSEFLWALQTQETTLAQKYSFLQEKSHKGLEGYLFPDTYRVYKDATSAEIISRLLDNFDAKVTSDLRQEITRQKKTIFEIVTMASLLEKEVVSDEDRALVSGILWKRLEHGIALQVDATIVYAKRQSANGQAQISNGKISTEDTKIKSPYNTYLNRGLPIGPISNPGLSAIKAAIYPQKSPYLYYLSAPDGRTIFSKTLEEHNMAKAKYLK